MMIASAPVLIKRALPAALTALLSVCLPSTTLANPGGVPAQPDRNPPFSTICVLGDSLSDTGRASAVVTALFGVPFPPPPYAPGRMSNGPLWIEYLAPQLRLAYQPLDNLAWAGAGTGAINVFGSFLPGMTQQLSELLGGPRPLDRKALYIVFGGANDFLRIFNGEPALNVINGGVANLVNTVIALRAAGARNIVVIDLPNIGRTPRALAGGPALTLGATILSVTFNTLLHSALDALPFDVVRVGAFELIDNMVAHPRKYGLTNVTSEGRLNPATADTHLFWDDVHPTTRAHAAVADAVFHALASNGKLGQQK